VPTITRQRSVALLAGCVAAGGVTATAASASTYGALVVRHSASPLTTLATSFTHVRPSGSFFLVVTEPDNAPLNFHWSIRCTSANGRETGGASGAATVANGHWVKRVGITWIKHPTSCSGKVEGSASRSPVLVRVFSAG
jgi:hypothetical protein